MDNMDNLYKSSQKFLKIIVGHLSFSPVFPLMEVASYYLFMLTSCQLYANVPKRFILFAGYPSYSAQHGLCI